MTDRELLEFAAKAIGRKLEQFLDKRYIIRDVDGQPVYWNPLTDDGNALRLAVKLRISVEPWLCGDSAFARAAVGEVLIDELHYGDDPYAATRRAIVCAAAEIGKDMP